jgi:predicted dehydrogenase
MWAPQYNRAEALRTEAFHFINCIEGKERPLSDGEMGLRVVKILEGATISMKERGRLVTLSL